MERVYLIEQPTRRFIFGALVSLLSAVIFIAIFVWSLFEDLGIEGLFLPLFLALAVTIGILIYAFHINLTAWRIATGSRPLELKLSGTFFYAYPLHRCDIFDARKPHVFDLTKAEITLVPAAYETIKITQQGQMTRVSAANRFTQGSFEELKENILACFHAEM